MRKNGKMMINRVPLGLRTIVALLILSAVCNYAASQTIIRIEKQGGVYLIPCKVNGLALKMILDTGASNVSISLSEALFMIKNGYLRREDLRGTTYHQIANGKIIEGTSIIIKEIEIGGVKIQNVEASVVHSLTAPLLMGQSALKKFGKFQIDYANNTLTLGDSPHESAKVTAVATSQGIVSMMKEDAIVWRESEKNHQIMRVRKGTLVRVLGYVKGCWEITFGTWTGYVQARSVEMRDGMAAFVGEIHKEEIVADLSSIALDAHLYRNRLKSMGGGGGTYRGYRIPNQFVNSGIAAYYASTEESTVVLSAQSFLGFGTIQVRVGEGGQLEEWKFQGRFGDESLAGEEPGIVAERIESTPPVSNVARNRDAMIADLTNLAAIAYQHRVRPLSMGGGGGSYQGYRIPDNLKKSENGTYVATEIRSDRITLEGVSGFGYGKVISSYDADGKLIGKIGFTGYFKW